MNLLKYNELCKAAGPVSRETYDRLVSFEYEFSKWAGKINLAAPSSLAELWNRHLVDSAQLLRYKPAAVHWLDLGSGGGFPGAIVAILLSSNPEARVDLIESNAKKATFLRMVLAQLKAPAQVHQIRIEDAYNRVPQPEVISARALAPLPILLALVLPWLERGATGLFHKGRDYRAEIAKSADEWRFRLIEHPSLTDSESAVLEISEVRRQP